MGLKEYNNKRHFNETAEPEGKEKASKGALKFVIQKHDASHLHYDFRLELNGVLISWAVPKGPSLNPADRRLAMQVEDHPYDYRNFEGIIPEGNYGAGTVIVWDEGTYFPLGGEKLDRKEQQKMMRQMLASGNIKIVMEGTKLEGEFALHRMKDERSWLLIKHRDKAASSKEIIKQNRSVKSGRTLAEVAKANGTEPKHPEKEISNKESDKPGKKAAAKALESAAEKTVVQKNKKSGSKKKIDIKKLLAAQSAEAKRAAMPKQVLPMMATLVDAAFDDAAWIFEIKWDGYRAVSFLQKGEVELVSRNLKAFTEKYDPVTKALTELPYDAVFDGEIVAIDEKGLTNFQLLQNWQNAPVTLHYYIFDLLWLDGYDLTALPLSTRKAILQQVLPANDPVIQYSDHVEAKGKAFFNAALKQGLEGVMGKRADSIYTVGLRSPDWLKIKVNQRQEVVIAGFTQPRNSRKYFGALLLGAYVEKELVYVGHTGSGFNTKSLEELHGLLQPLATDVCPFSKKPKANMPVTWVKPKLVCEIKFTEWTREGMARHPIFMGLRSDKKPKDVHIEKGKQTKAMVTKSAPAAKKPTAKKVAVKKTAAKKAAPKKSAPAKKSSSADKPAASRNTGKQARQLEASDDNQLDLETGGKLLTLTNLGKTYWGREGLVKRDMVNYYLRMAPYILPYLRQRPESLHRHPNGITGQHFYQKDMKGKMPDWIPTHKDFSESTNKDVHYLVCNDEATLLYMANLGCIEIHPWHSRVESWERPDWCLVDLDPEGVGFDKVIETALVVKQVLDSIGATSFVKTSGSTGIHIYIPLGAKYDYDQSRQLAELVVSFVHRELPELTSLERSPSKRKNKIYLDFLQNRQTQTAAAPYSLRPKPGAPVSTPLHWDEVKKGLTPQTWHINNILERVKSEGDLFKPVMGKGIDLAKVLKRVESL
jgi:bifunctional non-homologous end joining protein LigD